MKLAIKWSVIAVLSLTRIPDNHSERILMFMLYIVVLLDKSLSIWDGDMERALGTYIALSVTGRY